MIDDPYLEDVAVRLAELLERSRVDRLPEMLWASAMVMIREATEQPNMHWWRTRPASQLRGFRRGIAEGLALARFAASLQQAQHEAEWEAERPSREASADRDRERRRAQTLPAELARLAKAAARPGGNEPPGLTNVHNRADYPRYGVNPDGSRRTLEQARALDGEETQAAS